MSICYIYNLESRSSYLRKGMEREPIIDLGHFLDPALMAVRELIGESLS